MTDDAAPRPPLDPAELRAFARRDWGAPERLARAERAARSPELCFELAWELYLAAREACPGWPSEEDRRRDFEHHLAMRALLDRAGHVGRPAGRDAAPQSAVRSSESGVEQLTHATVVRVIGG